MLHRHRKAFAENAADFCTIVVPPNHHEAVIDVALAQASMSSAKSRSPTRWRLGAHRAEGEGRRPKDGGHMSHRFDQDKTTLRTIVRSGRLGRVNAVSCRYFSDMRKHMAWGALFRHTMDDPLIIEGAVHHLDLRRRPRRRKMQDAVCLHVEAGLGGVRRRHRRHGDDDFRERRARHLRRLLKRRRRSERLVQRICARRLARTAPRS